MWLPPAATSSALRFGSCPAGADQGAVGGARRDAERPRDPGAARHELAIARAADADLAAGVRAPARHRAGDDRTRVAVAGRDRRRRTAERHAQRRAALVRRAIAELAVRVPAVARDLTARVQ